MQIHGLQDAVVAEIIEHRVFHQRIVVSVIQRAAPHQKIGEAASVFGDELMADGFGEEGGKASAIAPDLGFGDLKNVMHVRCS